MSIKTDLRRLADSLPDDEELPVEARTNLLSRLPTILGLALTVPFMRVRSDGGPITVSSTWGPPWGPVSDPIPVFTIQVQATLTLYENVQYGGRSVEETDDRVDAFRDFGVSSIDIYTNRWVIFNSEFYGSGVKGSILAVKGPQKVPNLVNIPKVNSFPGGFGNGNWNDEIRRYILADNAPVMAITEADGITIIDGNGNISTGPGL